MGFAFSFPRFFVFPVFEELVTAGEAQVAREDAAGTDDAMAEAAGGVVAVAGGFQGWGQGR